MKRKKTLIIGHRGVKSLAKIENTIEAFKLAIKMGIQMVEFDVRRTKDGKMIIFHNDHIRGEKINHLTYAQLCDITKKYGYKAPLLEEVLKLCAGKIKLDIELKEAGYEKEALDKILCYISKENFIITTFLDCVVKVIKQCYPDVKVGLLIGLQHASIKQRITEIFPIKRLKKAKADFIVAHSLLVTKLFVYLCKKYHYDIYVWTVNKSKVYKKLMRQRVTAIITDYPQNFDRGTII